MVDVAKVGTGRKSVRAHISSHGALYIAMSISFHSDVTDHKKGKDKLLDRSDRSQFGRNLLYKTFFLSWCNGTNNYLELFGVPSRVLGAS